MADATGYDRGQIQRWETGERGIVEGYIPLHVQRMTELHDRVAELEQRLAETRAGRADVPAQDRHRSTS